MIPVLVEVEKNINIAVEGMSNEKGDSRVRKEIFGLG